MPDNIVKAIQQMKRPTIVYPAKPPQATCLDSSGNLSKDLYDMGKFMWNDDYKAIRIRKDK
jgi:hypothetical protein